MGKTLVGEGEFTLVKQYLENALHISSSWIGDHDVLTMLTDVAAMQLDEVAIRQYAAQAEELAIRYDHKLYQAVIHRAWGIAYRLSGEYTQAELRLNASLAIFNHLNARWQIGRTLYELGELAQAQADAARASQAFTRALSAFEVMKAAPDMVRTKVALSRQAR